MACPAGTFSDKTGNAVSTAADCEECPAGNYCLGGNSEPDGDCAVNHYCEPGSTNEEANKCPGGTYNLSGALKSSTECIVCPKGQYCVDSDDVAEEEAYVQQPADCPAGTYLNYVGAETDAECITCDAGFKCPSDAEIAQTVLKGLVCEINKFVRNVDSDIIQKQVQLYVQFAQKDTTVIWKQQQRQRWRLRHVRQDTCAQKGQECTQQRTGDVQWEDTVRRLQQATTGSHVMRGRIILSCRGSRIQIVRR